MGVFNSEPYYSTGFQMVVEADGNLLGFVRNDDALQNERASGTVNDDVWHYVVIAWEYTSTDDTMTVFIDGASQGTSVYDREASFSDWQFDMLIGAVNSRGTVGTLFTGLIDEIEVYNYALTVDDVAIAYEGYTGEDTCVYPPALDFTGPDDSNEDGVFDADCVVDIYDFAYFASSWLECGLIPACL